MILLYTTLACASQSRVSVLGTGEASLFEEAEGAPLSNSGSLIYPDSSNIFYSPSAMNQFFDFAMIEKSTSLTTSSQSENFHGLQGGMVFNFLHFNWGFYFNRSSAVSSHFSHSDQMIPIDLMIAADDPLPWGIGLSVGHRSKGTRTDWDIALQASLDLTNEEGSGVEPFLSTRLYSRERVSENKDLENYRAGVRLKWKRWVNYWIIDRSRVNRSKDWIFGGGIGRQHLLADSVFLNTAIGLWRKTSSRRTVIPVDLSFEGEVRKWLTLRAGLHYRLLDQKNGNSSFDSTTGRLGASFLIDRIELSCAVGKGEASAEQTRPQIDAQSLGINDGFFASTSLIYRW